MWQTQPETLAGLQLAGVFFFVGSKFEILCSIGGGIHPVMADENTPKNTSKNIPPLRHKSVVVLDTETTGLEENPEAEVIELAVVDLEGNTLIDTKIKPVNLEIALAFDEAGTKKALEINGYNEADWADAPTFEELVPQIVEVFKHKVIVGQNPQFDRNFILRGLKRAGVEKAYRVLSRHAIDTTVLSWEHLAPCGLNRLGLSFACNFLGIPIDRESRHGALEDAQATRTLYLMLLRATEEQRFAWRSRAKKLGLFEI